MGFVHLIQCRSQFSRESNDCLPLCLAEYVRLYVDFVLNTSVATQYESFERGFNEVTSGNGLSLFQGDELELLVRGSLEELDIELFKRVTVYEGFDLGEGDLTVQ